ncbi:beta-ketoacyl-ACP synthase, partial [Vibrio breoganii]
SKTKLAGVNAAQDTSNIALLGCGDSSDAHHISAPHPEGNGAEQAMKKALHSAQLNAEDIGYINAHGTATPLNDSMESKAIHRIFANKVPVSSTKPLTGHTLGAASAIEA